MLEKTHAEEPPERVLVSRSDVAEVVGATGVLQAMITVQVGSQVSGTIRFLVPYASSR
mgnify:CR=1 FL=1